MEPRITRDGEHWLPATSAALRPANRDTHDHDEADDAHANGPSQSADPLPFHCDINYRWFIVEVQRVAHECVSKNHSRRTFLTPPRTTRGAQTLRGGKGVSGDLTEARVPSVYGSALLRIESRPTIRAWIRSTSQPLHSTRSGYNPPEYSVVSQLG